MIELVSANGRVFALWRKQSYYRLVKDIKSSRKLLISFRSANRRSANTYVSCIPSQVRSKPPESESTSSKSSHLVLNYK